MSRRCEVAADIRAPGTRLAHVLEVGLQARMRAARLTPFPKAAPVEVKRDPTEREPERDGTVNKKQAITPRTVDVPRNAYIGKLSDTPWVFMLGTQPLQDWPDSDELLAKRMHSQQETYRQCFTHRDMSHIQDAFKELLQPNMKSVPVRELELDSKLNNEDPIYLPKASWFQSYDDPSDEGQLRFSPFFVLFGKNWDNYQFTKELYDGFKAPFLNEGRNPVDLHITLPQRLPAGVLKHGHPELVERFEILERRYRGSAKSDDASSGDAHSVVVRTGAQANAAAMRAEKEDLSIHRRNLKYYEYEKKKVDDDDDDEDDDDYDDYDDVTLPTVALLSQIPRNEVYRYKWLRDTSNDDEVTGVLINLDNLVLAMPTSIVYDVFIKMWYNPATKEWSKRMPKKDDSSTVKVNAAP